ncbi:MAG: leucyl/phenylalanyl-tRNA--protein transferase [Bacteroidota bacterium]|nr:leucyl/phenylalanyl-tRNA--protein transferase [Bacteroidota bacterium]
MIFPHPEEALEDGLLAVGGDLSMERILLAYQQGIFPWYSEGSPILWWSTNPRMVLFPDKLVITKSLQQVINRKAYEVKFDHDFSTVIRQCASVARKEQAGTWITEEIVQAYELLHHQGYAHSVEAYDEGELVGGLYGISMGKVFFGESMFHLKPDASKVALYYLVEKLKSWHFQLIDAQQETEHLKRMGAIAIPRKEFLEILKTAVNEKSHIGNWEH